MISSQFAFTLAEVLITLVIIGVIAAITVPSLITRYQKEQTVTRLKKAYSALAQTTQKAVADNGPINTWEVDNSVFPEKYLIPYLNIGKNCKFDTTTDICKYKYYYLNDKNNAIGISSRYHFYLNDGTLIMVYTVTGNPNRIYADVYVDINGQKKPNTFGKDLFWFRYEISGTIVTKYQRGKFNPVDFSTTRDNALNNSDHGCNKQAHGSYCSTLIMKDGWQIKDDYPW